MLTWKTKPKWLGTNNGSELIWIETCLPTNDFCLFIAGRISELMFFEVFPRAFHAPTQFANESQLFLLHSVYFWCVMLILVWASYWNSRLFWNDGNWIASCYHSWSRRAQRSHCRLNSKCTVNGCVGWTLLPGVPRPVKKFFVLW